MESVRFGPHQANHSAETAAQEGTKNGGLNSAKVSCGYSRSRLLIVVLSEAKDLTLEAAITRRTPNLQLSNARSLACARDYELGIFIAQRTETARRLFRLPAALQDASGTFAKSDLAFPQQRQQ